MSLNLASRAVSALLTAIVATACAAAQPATEALKAELAPSGTLRAAINYNNPLLARRDAATGELSGIAVDLSRELARRTGVPLELIPYDAAGRISDAAKAGAWDIAYLAIDPARAADIEFTAAYIELEGTYLVPAGSPLQKVEDVDRDGVRIAVAAKSAYDLFLSRNLKHATIVRAETTPLSVKMMIDQKLDAVAAVRTALANEARRMPGSRVMSGHFMTIPQAAGVPKGRPAAARYVSEFIEEVRASGFVAQALERHGLGPDDAIVAGSASPVHVATYLEVRSSSTSEAAALATKYARDTRRDAGNVDVTALQEIGRPDRFVVIEAWKDQDAFTGHEQATHTLEVRSKLRVLQRSPYDQRVNRTFAVDPLPRPAGRKAVFVVTHVDVPGARRQEAEALLKPLFEASRGDPGLLRYDIYQQMEPRMNHFTLFAVWDSRHALEAYGGTPHWLQFREALAPMLGALYDERIYRRIEP